MVLDRRGLASARRASQGVVLTLSLVAGLWLLACAPPTPPGQPPPGPAPAGQSPPGQTTVGGCSCEAACDCYGVDDPERDAARNRARESCAQAGVRCACGRCQAP
ncbi:MAG: hypothetical protein KC731_27595 [Myxococcales bacterium]|nr:hypothetical protein [Myxococcales bacterium]